MPLKIISRIVFDKKLFDHICHDKYNMANSFLDNSIGYNINMSGLLLKRALIAVFKREGYDITPEQWAILSRLEEMEGLSQHNVALSTFKDNANITRIVDKLENKALVERRKHEADRRTWLLYITNKGRETVHKLQPLAKEVLKSATVGINEDELKLSNKCIQKIIKNLH